MSQLKVIMNADTVLPDRDTSIFYLLAVFVTSRREVNVVRLPCERREAGVDFRFCNRIDPAALVVLAFQTKRIQHLAFVAALNIDTTVAARLTACRRLERCAKLDVQFVVAEFFFRLTVRQPVDPSS